MTPATARRRRLEALLPGSDRTAGSASNERQVSFNIHLSPVES
jgi:hypothetical protein